jgi:hypothetical protein
MCPQAPRSPSEYSHKAGLQIVITEKPLQIRPVIHSVVRGLLQWAEFYEGLHVGRGRKTGRPRRRPSSCSLSDEGCKLSVALLPLLQRDWRRHRAKGSVFAFAPTPSWRSAMVGAVGVRCDPGHTEGTTGIIGDTRTLGMRITGERTIRTLGICRWSSSSPPHRHLPWAAYLDILALGELAFNKFYMYAAFDCQSRLGEIGCPSRSCDSPESVRRGLGGGTTGS